jgi:hypothetical protein
MLQENVEVLQRFNDAFNRRDLANPAPRLELPGL